MPPSRSVQDAMGRLCLTWLPSNSGVEILRFSAAAVPMQAENLRRRLERNIRQNVEQEPNVSWANFARDIGLESPPRAHDISELRNVPHRSPPRPPPVRSQPLPARVNRQPIPVAQDNNRRRRHAQQYIQPQPGEIYPDNSDLDFNGGAELRTIYCGLKEKPPHSVYGNRRECLQKGWGLGASHIKI